MNNFARPVDNVNNVKYVGRSETLREVFSFLVFYVGRSETHPRVQFQLNHMKLVRKQRRLASCCRV